MTTRSSQKVLTVFGETEVGSAGVQLTEGYPKGTAPDDEPGGSETGPPPPDPSVVSA